MSLKTGQCLCKALGFFESLLGSFQGSHGLCKTLGVFASRVGSFKASCGLYELCGVFGNYVESLQVFWVLCKALGILKIFWGSLQVSGGSLKVLGFFCSFLGIFGNHAESLEVSMGLWKALGFFASCAASLQACCGLCNLPAAFGRLMESRILCGDKREDLPVPIAQEALEAQTHSASCQTNLGPEHEEGILHEAEVLFPTQALLCAIRREISPGKPSRDVCANRSTRTLMSGGSWFRSYS